MAIYLPVGSLLYFNTLPGTLTDTLKLTEHNRQPVSFNTARIEKIQRMSNGSLRKFFVADKRTITVSWNMLPSYKAMTIDGGMGALDLKAFYNGTAAKATAALSGQTNFDLLVRYGAGTVGTTEVIPVIFSSFSIELLKRNVKEKTADTAQEFWNVSLSMEEI